MRSGRSAQTPQSWAFRRALTLRSMREGVLHQKDIASVQTGVQRAIRCTGISILTLTGTTVNTPIMQPMAPRVNDMVQAATTPMLSTIFLGTPQPAAFEGTLILPYTCS